MKYSLNTTFDQLAFQAGPDNVADTAHAMGIADDEHQRHEDAAGPQRARRRFGIGIGDYAGAPLDQAVGFATLRQRRQAQRPVLRQKATASDGEVVYSHKFAPSRPSTRGSPTT